ncbi:YjzC family protein [Paenibacillus wulumuqiensis]|uniref:YjzC family protein n=1 Tax=Paenibacillus wulumuqiensis TaxID=1567107 RepID=UPI00061988AD|nr:YjzC family protein [Paenibacillus wulumuqiensis]
MTDNNTDNNHKPGEKVPDSGQYQERGPHEQKVTENETTAVEGNTFPPTDKAGDHWTLVDKTKHKRG